jgi:hypothetical protein
MSHRGAHRLLPAVVVCAIAGVAACAGGDDVAAAPGAPPEFEATFEVERPLQVVAGNNQSWVLEEVDGGAALSRVEHTGARTDVADLIGQSHVMAAYGDGLVVARVACDGDRCEETVTEVLVLDAEGSGIAEEELAREPGSPEAESGSFDRVWLAGVDGKVIWLETSEGLVSYEPDSGRTGTGSPDRGGPEWISAAPAFFDPSAYQSPPDVEAPPEAVAAGGDGQVFVHQGPGVVRRVTGPPGAPVSEEEVRVPAEVFSRPVGARANLYFDTSPTVVTGCLVTEYPAGRCYIGSP